MKTLVATCSGLEPNHKTQGDIGERVLEDRPLNLIFTLWFETKTWMNKPFMVFYISRECRLVVFSIQSRAGLGARAAVARPSVLRATRAP
ncbi:unnamed protein product [Dovyalis caffra]|uniref:Uncharacterized protein n=1 Tax=Dovyalis caffra TaxID=77055 RepID=A0AAV1RPD1_9ROSI|nr:unnamed protein product [Dovyalis caffra]